MIGPIQSKKHFELIRANFKRTHCFGSMPWRDFDRKLFRSSLIFLLTFIKKLAKIQRILNRSDVTKMLSFIGLTIASTQ